MLQFRLWFSCLALASSLAVRALAGDDPQGLRKITDDVDRKFTSIGKIGLTITNFATIGTRNSYWPQQPSCEYPLGSRIEHIYQGGLWVGAQLKTRDSLDSRNGLILVSTGASDRSSRSTNQQLVDGFEYNTGRGETMLELSTLADERPRDAQSSQLAVSHQDFVANYTDSLTRIPATGDSIVNHTPLHIVVHQESYAWNFPFADFFVILRYQIFNAGADTLDSVYVGIWNNAVVRNTSLVRPGTPGYYDWTGQGFDSTARMAYSFDYSGTPVGPPADSYIGVKLLGTTPFPSHVDSIGDLHRNTFYNAWQFRLNDPNALWYAAPTDDYNTDPYLSRYSRMTQSMPQNYIDPLRVSPKNVSYLLSTGPFSRLNPHDSLEVVFAVVCAKKFGSGPASNDTRVQRQTLYANAGWAQQAYNGEDVNGNDKLDPGEDIARRDSTSPNEVGLRYEPDGVLTRYLLPAPPSRPKTRVEVENQSVVIYWDKATSEESVDPITGKKDFEGYRIYRSVAGQDFKNHDLFLSDIPMVGEFDRSDDAVGYNTGFGQILLDTAKRFPGDSIVYSYRFPPRGVNVSHLNGWQYIYAVSAFDAGDSINGVPSLESAKSVHRVVPGTPATLNKDVQIGVYPNPYYVNAYWDGSRERLRKIYFYNLPPRCEIRIYTLAGDVVTVLDHEASTYAGEGIDWFSEFGDRSTTAEFAGGEHAWDLITRYDQAIATGLYLFTVENKDSGQIKRGKFMVIK
jgi:hypothetical protein